MSSTTREALETFGLRFTACCAGDDRPAWLGVTTRNDAGRLLVAQVRRDTPARTAGLNVDDEILAIDEFRVRADRLENRLEQYKPGDTVSMLVARRDQLLRLDVDARHGAAASVAPRRQPSAPARSQQARSRWLQPPR